MPDHLHLVWMGLRRDSDPLNGMAFRRRYLEPALAPAKFQPQAQDSVLRETERERGAFARVCFYILHNPVKAELAARLEAWSFCGAVVPGYPILHPLEPDFWEKFWNLYGKSRHPDAGDIKKPPF